MEGTELMSSLSLGAKIGIAAGAAVVGAGIYFGVKAIRNHSEGFDTTVNKYLDTFDRGHRDRAINLEFETAITEHRTSQTWISDGNGGGYYRYNSYDETKSMRPLAERADRDGNNDGTADYNEMVKVLKRYDVGDGPKHVAGDERLGGGELRNFNRDYGIRHSTSYGYGGF